MWNPGKVLTFAILAVGVAAGLFAWQHQYRKGAQVMKLWGADNAYRIRLAPTCELVQLAQSSDDPTQTLRIDDRDWPIVQRTDISQAHGLIHAREALIQDVSYRWDAPTGPADWNVAIVFGDPDQPDQQTVLAIDLKSGAICDVESGRRGNLSPIVGGLKAFFDEQWVNLAR